MKQQQPGFILLAVFFMLTMAVILVTQIYYKAVLYNSFIPVVIQREHAKQLAQSGIALALNQLALQDQKLTPPTEKKDAQKNEQNPEMQAKQLLKVLLTVKNKWQKFSFTQTQDGFEGELSICITCEDGKIPLNALIDYDQKTFKSNKSINFDGAAFFKDLFESIVQVSGGPNFFESVTSFIKEQKFIPHEITQLVTAKEVKLLRNQLFYIPQEEGQRQEICLADLFTLWQDQPTVNPLLFSAALQIIYRLNAQSLLKSVDQELIDKIIEKFSLTSANWQKDWDTFLKPIYGVSYNDLPKELTPLFSLKFEPRVFSVLCYAKVAQVEQKLVAIIARRWHEQEEIFEVKKIYWL
ncbi:MAG: hypothetical protein EBU90_05630 [Proteobacteria bacterium]|jgi:hypothetical protein|nr:hypothetical protein [Pseudomonadota bacterium]NBP13956.1 hypothetical protein [bacterium]